MTPLRRSDKKSISLRHKLGRAMLLGILPVSFGSAAQAADYSFVWTGSNDFRLEGAFRTDDAPNESGLMTAENVMCFRMVAFRNDKAFGEWRLGTLNDTMAWHFNFAPETAEILTGGGYLSTRDQQWNSAASYNMCGKGELGFNAGSGGQELCFNGRLIYNSEVSSGTRLFANPDETLEFDDRDCQSLMIS